jgi:hypothetical protein
LFTPAAGSLLIALMRRFPMNGRGMLRSLSDATCRLERVKLRRLVLGVLFVALAPTFYAIASAQVAHPISGGETPESEITTVSNARLGPDGHVYVADRNHVDIRVFDVAGKHMLNIGRLGAGPGEFRSIREFGWLADTLWVLDVSLQRVSLFRKDGSFIRSDPILQGDVNASNIPGALVQDGGVLAEFTMRDPAAMQVLPLIRMSRVGTIRDTLFELSGGRERQPPLKGAGKRRMVLTQPFPERSIWDVDRSGNWLAVVERSAPNGHDSSTFRVAILNFISGKVFRLTVLYEPVRISLCAIDSVLQRYRGVSEATLREILFLPDFFPPVRSMVTSSTGDVWLDLRDGLESGTWIRIDTDGKVTRRMRLPPDYFILDADANHVLAVQRDPDGVHPALLVYDSP